MRLATFLCNTFLCNMSQYLCYMSHNMTQFVSIEGVSIQWSFRLDSAWYLDVWRRQSSRKRTHFITISIWPYARSRAIYKCIGKTYLKISKSFLAIWTHERRSIRIISFFWFNFFLHFMKLILWTVHFWSILGEKLVWNGRVWLWLGLSHIY